MVSRSAGHRGTSPAGRAMLLSAVRTVTRGRPVSSPRMARMYGREDNGHARKGGSCLRNFRAEMCYEASICLINEYSSYAVTPITDGTVTVGTRTPHVRILRMYNS